MALGLSTIGFALPLAGSIAHANNVVDMVIWGDRLALIVQLSPITSRSSPSRSLEAHRGGRIGPAICWVCLGNGRSHQRRLDDHMKRSAQVALVLMGVTGTTAAASYMMPSRAECRRGSRGVENAQSAVRRGASSLLRRPPSRAAAARGAAGARIAYSSHGSSSY